MGMKDALPFLGMVSMQFIQVGIIVAIKEATSNGMTKFTFIFYTNAIAALILLPTSFLVHRYPFSLRHTHTNTLCVYVLEQPTKIIGNV